MSIDINLTPIIEKLKDRLKLYLLAETCLACGKRGFIHSWSGLDRMEVDRRLIFGLNPGPGQCELCGQKFEPVLVNMRNLGLWSGRKGWLYGWWKLKS